MSGILEQPPERAPSYSVETPRERSLKLGKLPVWVVTIPGFGHTAESYGELAPQLESAGINHLSVNLPARNPLKNFDDYAGHVVKQMKTQGIQRAVLLASSRGGDTAARVPERARGIEIEELVLLASALHASTVYNFSEKEKRRGQDVERNPEIFLQSMRDLPFSMARFDKKLAPEVLYNRSSKEIGAKYTGKLQAQRRNAKEPVLERWPWEVPVTCVHGLYDNAVTLDWGRYRADMLRTNLIELPADHSPHIGLPETITELVASRISRVY